MREEFLKVLRNMNAPVLSYLCIVYCVVVVYLIKEITHIEMRVIWVIRKG